MRTYIAFDVQTKQNVKHGRDLIAADVRTILIHVFDVFTERTLQANSIIETTVPLFKKNRWPRACSKLASGLSQNPTLTTFDHAHVDT